MCKMVNITKKTYENNDIEVITDTFGELWLNETHVQQLLGHKIFSAFTNKYSELIDYPINSYVEDLFILT